MNKNKYQKLINYGEVVYDRKHNTIMEIVNINKDVVVGKCINNTLRETELNNIERLDINHVRKFINN